MKAIIEQIFGTYTPPTYAVTDYVDIDGTLTAVTTNIVPPGCAGVDWVYIAGVVLFAICLYSVFRIIGSVFK